MPLPAPTPLAARPTVALGCTGLHFLTATLREAREKGFAPVLMHHLTGGDGTADDGPREMLAVTAEALANAGHSSAWGAGCVVRTAADAAAFAAAGYSWFSFALGDEIDSRAECMSLDELDAAIVALEDSGGYAPAWHAHYTDREWLTASGRKLRFADEALARVAVKFGRALAHAAQLQQAIRTLWSGHGAAPDIELCFAGRRDRWSDEEFLFLALESARSGLCPVCISPSLGAAWQPGAEYSGDQAELESLLASAGQIAALAGLLKVGIHHAAGKADIASAAKRILGPRTHLDFEEDAWLASLDALAHQQPELFRRWLGVAQEMLPFAAGDAALAITEEDIHVLPQVGDEELSATFLADMRGRQLLLSTFPDVLRKDRALREAVSAGPRPR
ncbi:MAG: tagaturonate epimerase family protein [Chthoniobacteraceae bacterium]